MSNDHDVTGESPAPFSVSRVPTGRVRAVVAPLPGLEAGPGAILPSEAEAIFELVVAVMWSDGELAKAEVERGRAAAEVMSVRSRRGGAFGAIAAGPLPFGEIDFDGLSLRARRLAFAAAEWLADAAPDPSERRSGFVRALQIRLGIDDDDARWLGEVAIGLGREHADAREGFGALMRAVLRGIEPA
jgi:hypothetical protein